MIKNWCEKIDILKKYIGSLELIEYPSALNMVEYMFKFTAKDDFEETYDGLFGGTKFVSRGHQINSLQWPGTPPTSGYAASGGQFMKTVPPPYTASPNQLEYKLSLIHI